MGKIKRGFSFLLFLFILIFLLLSDHQEAKGTTITVKPGKFSHFILHIPSAPIAGENSILRLQSFDIYNNFITDFNETGKDFEIHVSGSAQVEPKVLKASSFRGGSALVNIRDKKAETVTLSIFEMGGTLPILSKEITVRPNKPDHFVLQAPSQVKAGESFEIKVIARDAFENILVDDSGLGKNFKVNIAGTGGLKYTDTGTLNFRAGVATAGFVPGKVGEATIEIYDSLSGSRGKTTSIRIMPSGLSSFSVQTPKEGVAGNPFEVIITALDSHGNLVTNYDTVGDGVILTSNGKGRIHPDRISPSEFRGGNAIAKVVYEVAENIQVVATESNKRERGRSGVVNIRPATPDHFIVTSPKTASAGQGFKLRIEAFDRFKNLIPDYNLIGGDVYLSTTGSGTLNPSVIPSSEFINGLAVINTTYDKAESFSITARMAHRREAIKIEEKKEEVKPPVKKVELLPPKVAEEKPKPVLPKVKKEIAKKPEEKKPEPQEVKKPEPKKGVSRGPYEVSNIGIVESKKRAVVIVTSNGVLDHTASLVTKDGKRWLSLKVSPAVRKMEKKQRLKSSFVGDVVLEEEGNALNIMLEILPEKVKYETKISRNSITVTFTAQ